MSIWDTIAAPIIAIINKVVPDKAAAAAAVAAFQQMQLQGQLNDELAQLQAVTVNQTDVDKIEAANPNLFIAGWRPFVGWVCGVGLAMSVILNPLLTWVSALFGHSITLPKLDDPLLQSTLAGMLGLGYGLRTLEKFKGVAGNH